MNKRKRGKGAAYNMTPPHREREREAGGGKGRRGEGEGGKGREIRGREGDRKRMSRNNEAPSI